MTLRERLKADEDEILHLYYVDGVPHIGPGLNLLVPPLEEVRRQITITSVASDVELDRRIKGAASDLYAHLPWAVKLDEVRREALIQIVYNMGIGNLLNKNGGAVASIERGRYEDARRQLLGGTWERQIGDRARRICGELVSGVRG